MLFSSLPQNSRKGYTQITNKSFGISADFKYSLTKVVSPNYVYEVVKSILKSVNVFAPQISLNLIQRRDLFALPVSIRRCD